MSIYNQRLPYIFESVTITSERVDRPFEIKDVVTDFEVYEHLDKPYLTAKILFSDNTNFYEKFDFVGGERLEIEIRSMKDSNQANPSIIKTFYITSTQIDIYNNESQIILLNLIEDIGFISNLTNLNKHYFGRVSNIITSIARDYLGKNVIADNNDIQNIDVIIPNMNPIETLMWLKNRAETIQGYPFYFYSTFVNDELYFRDLGTLLRQNPINPDYPFTHNKAATNTTGLSVIPPSRSIISHKFELQEDLFMLISKGLVGANYEYINTLEEQNIRFDFDIQRDLLNDLQREKVLLTSQPNPPYASAYQINDLSFNEHRNRYITMVGGTNSRRNNLNEIRMSYSEENNISGYKRQIISRAMDNILKKTPFSMVVDGTDFLDGINNYGVGNIAEIFFTKTNPNNKMKNLEDTKKSGRYLLYSARHMFKKERYDISFSCVKLGNREINE